MDIRFAPMEGLTDTIYRRTHYQHFSGVSKYYIPFVSPTQHHVFTPKEMRAIGPEYNAGIPTVPQILAKDAEHFLWAAGEMCKMGYEEVNLNIGCPSGTVTAKGKGSGMLRDLYSLDSFLNTVCAKSPVAISVKTRIGFESPEEWTEILDVLAEYPLKEIIIHPRTRSGFYKAGTICPECFEAAAEKELPLVYNGDLFTASDMLHAGGINVNNREMQILNAIREEMDTLPGHTGFYYLNLVTGVEYGVREGEIFGAASVIKLPLYMHVMAEAAAGRMSMDEQLTITQADKVPICGALTLFTGDVQADVRTLCKLMISISDNTATNKLIDYSTIPGAQAGFRRMGLEKTQLTRKLFDKSASLAGLRNTICPKEIGHLLAMLYRNEFVNANVCKEIIDTLLLQQVDHKLNGKICGEVAVAHKTGEDDQLSNDVGIVYAKEPFVICFAGHDTDVYRWEDLMRRRTYDLYALHNHAMPMPC